MGHAPDNFLERIRNAMAAAGLFARGEKIIVAVSGGVDSMVLLHVLHHLAGADRWRLTVAHFNHRLRGPDSDADEQLVRRVSRKLKVPITVRRGGVLAESRRRGWSIEMAARQLRHEFLADAARRTGSRVVALAHHRDDQVELFFLRLLRGAGTDGLAGMKWRNPSPAGNSIMLVRPLLGCAKDELRQFAQRNGIAFSEDATNGFLEILRNRVRQKLLPLLRSEFQPALDENILRAMDLIGAESDATRAAAQVWLETPVRSPLFNTLPVALQRKVLQIQLFDSGLSVDFALIERLRLDSLEPVAVAPHLYVSRDASGGVLLHKNAPGKFSSAEKALTLAVHSGSTVFGGVTFSWEVADIAGAEFSIARHTEQFDAGRVGRKIVLRHWRPGDRFQPIGATSASKLQDIFTNLKVPADERRRRVIAATRQGDIFWVQGLRISEKFKLGPRTRRRLLWRWHD